jgi:hypothetical protein
VKNAPGVRCDIRYHAPEKCFLEGSQRKASHNTRRRLEKYTVNTIDPNKTSTTTNLLQRLTNTMDTTISREDAMKSLFTEEDLSDVTLTGGNKMNDEAIQFDDAHYWNLELDDGEKLEDLLSFAATPSFRNDIINVNDIDTTTSGIITKPAAKKKEKTVRGPSRRKKKPKGMPKRPLSAYNLFFQKERLNVIEDHAERVTFEDLGRSIGQRWRALSQPDRIEYEKLAEVEVERYRKERDAYDDSKRNKQLQRMSRPIDDNDTGTGTGSGTGMAMDTNATVETRETNTFLPAGPPPISPPVVAQLPPAPAPAPATAMYNTASRPPPPGLMSPFPFYPGMAITLPDQYGREIQYNVGFKCYTMKKSEAETFMNNFGQSLPPG